MADEIDHPHDRLFRAVFSDAAEAASLLQTAVPQELRDAVDWSSLRLLEGTFVDDALRQSESDLLFEAGYGKETERHGRGKDRLRLYLLFEHQSTPDVWMRYRLLKYCCRIWDADLRDDPRRTELQPVVPLVFYQGARDWRHSTGFADLFPAAVRDWPWVLRFEHVLLDQTGLDPGDVEGATMGRIVQLLMMAAFGRHTGAALETAAKLAVSLVSGGAVDYIRIIAVYLFSMPDKAAANAFDEALRRHQGGQGGGIMSYAQELLEEGRAEGREEGLQRGKVEAVEGFLRIGVSWDVITSATGIDEPRFRALKERLAAAAQHDETA